MRLSVEVRPVLTIYPTTADSDRRRFLQNWALEFTQLSGDRKLYYLTGQVTREANGEVPSARFAKTSPIVKLIQYNISDDETGWYVITVTGSHYMLGRAVNVEQANPETWLPEVFNPWIDGDNWVTAV